MSVKHHDRKLTPLERATDKSKRPLEHGPKRGLNWLFDDQYWVTALGEKVAIASMHPEHARNAKNMLLRRRRAIVRSLSWRATMDVAMHDGGEWAHDTLERIQEEYLEAESAESHKPQVDIIKELPLFKALKRQSRRKSWPGSR
jgi:hypothetical protein